MHFSASTATSTPDLLFRGSIRSGYKVPPSADLPPPAPVDPLPMHALLDADLWQGMMVEDVPEWQPTMFQPIGGMDRIPSAFASRLEPVIRYGAAVTRIRQSVPASPSTIARRRRSKTISADYCICAMPLHCRAHALTPTSARRFATSSTRSSTTLPTRLRGRRRASGRRKPTSTAASRTCNRPVDLSGTPARAFSENGNRRLSMPSAATPPEESGTAFGKTAHSDRGQARSLAPLHRSAASRPWQRSRQSHLYQLGPDPVQPRLVDR